MRWVCWGLPIHCGQPAPEAFLAVGGQSEASGKAKGMLNRRTSSGDHWNSEGLLTRHIVRLGRHLAGDLLLGNVAEYLCVSWN